MFGDIFSDMVDVLGSTYLTLVVTDAYEELGKS
jgi:hypothetical protein